MLRVIDTHAHLDIVPHLDTALETARQAGVTAIIAVGSDTGSNRAILGVGKRYKGFVFPALGLHPWRLEGDVEAAIRFIEGMVGDCVAIGEVGLDYWIKVAKTVQSETLTRLIKVAVMYDKPLIIHSRGAWEEASRIVRELDAEKAVFHWYSGPLKVLKGILDAGYFVSASPAVAYSRSHRAAITYAPIENIVLETDSPVRYRGVESEPVHIVKTLKAVAELKGMAENTVAEKTTENAVNLFALKLQGS